MSDAQVPALAGALAKAQLEMKNPGFDSTNPHFKSRYASLASVRDAVVSVLAKHGIAVVQELTTSADGVSCVTRLMHASGEVLQVAPLTIPLAKRDAHGIGAASTYARRYALMAVAGVVGDEDDDGNAVAEKPKYAVPPAPPPERDDLPGSMGQSGKGPQPKSWLADLFAGCADEAAIDAELAKLRKQAKSDPSIAGQAKAIKANAEARRAELKFNYGPSPMQEGEEQ
jgi:hypothetical protein